MTFATVMVLPDPVTPSSVWKRSPRCSPAHSSVIALGFRPVDLETPLRLMCEKQQVRTVSAMDAHAAATRHVADDGIARHRLTALCIAHHDAVDALDPDAPRPAHPVDEALEG